MQEAIEAVIEYGFHVMKLRLIEAVPNPSHLRSIRLLERDHFMREVCFQTTDAGNGVILERVMYILKNNCLE